MSTRDEQSDDHLREKTLTARIVHLFEVVEANFVQETDRFSTFEQSHRRTQAGFVLQAEKGDVFDAQRGEKSDHLSIQGQIAGFGVINHFQIVMLAFEFDLRATDLNHFSIAEFRSFDQNSLHSCHADLQGTRQIAGALVEIQGFEDASQHRLADLSDAIGEDISSVVGDDVRDLFDLRLLLNGEGFDRAGETQGHARDVGRDGVLVAKVAHPVANAVGGVAVVRLVEPEGAIAELRVGTMEILVVRLGDVQIVFDQIENQFSALFDRLGGHRHQVFVSQENATEGERRAKPPAPQHSILLHRTHRLRQDLRRRDDHARNITVVRRSRIEQPSRRVIGVLQRVARQGDVDVQETIVFAFLPEIA